MAESESIIVAPGVAREDFTSGYWLIGTKKALLAAGLAKEEWFWNGRRASDGRRLTTVHFKIDGNRATCGPYCQSDTKYMIEVAYPKEEWEKRRQAAEHAVQKRLELERAEARRERMLEALATTGGVRKKASAFLDHASGLVAVAFNAADDPENPWGFPAETLEKVKWHFREILQLFDDGSFEIRPGSILQGDAKFERFMQRAVSDPDQAQA